MFQVLYFNYKIFWFGSVFRLKNLQYKIKTSRCIFFFFLRREEGRDSVNLQQREFHGAIVNIFDDLWSAFLTFYVWNNLNWICLREINIFVLFLLISIGESVTVLFTPTANIDSEIFSCLASFEDLYRGEVHSKVPNCFCSKVLKLVNLTNRREGEFKIINSSFCKRKLQRTNKI